MKIKLFIILCSLFFQKRGRRKKRKQRDWYSSPFSYLAVESSGGELIELEFRDKVFGGVDKEALVEGDNIGVRDRRSPRKVDSLADGLCDRNTLAHADEHFSKSMLSAGRMSFRTQQQQHFGN